MRVAIAHNGYVGRAPGTITMVIPDAEPNPPRRYGHPSEYGEFSGLGDLEGFGALMAAGAPAPDPDVLAALTRMQRRQLTLQTITTVALTTLAFISVVQILRGK